MSVPASNFRTRALFGGAMACDLPDYLEDMSKIRVVPDQQEAFFNGDGSISVIIEVLEYQQVPDAKAAEFFFNDLMEANSALSSRILESWTALKGESSVAGHTMASLKGEFEVIKNRAASADHVCVRLAVIRIPEHRADIVISMNERTNDTAGVNDAQTNASGSLDRTFHTIIESFKILNYELFA
ncbi:mog1 protein, putative [Eimeria brunetti]|uniref:Mog1 protein, putative n=1 Tax=Eimeria brunetti TaxID=51314 RepID=U6LG62_9EIME|nr:mog1 protein, putative [Eimeria brunetti]